ncbi:MAG: TrkA family potassium uptake protein [Planctomycetes bacterium]|nr:TrkA family potassium uptake protein [Planctomycetota bacterium]
MLSKQRRARAWLIYLQKPIRRFLPLFAFVMALVLLGGVAFYFLYQQQRLGFTEAIYVTFCLIFMEHLYPYPHHPLLELFYFILPPLGLILVLDGFVRFTYAVVRRDEHSPDWVRSMSETMNNHVVLFGLGKVGFRILQQLIALHELVVVIEKDPHCPSFAYAAKHGVAVRVGHGREEGILDDVNIKGAKSLICATDDDLANLELAMDARKVKKDLRVVLRMYDQELAEKIRDTMDIELAFSTAMLAAPTFATASADKAILNSFYVDDRLLVIARIPVNEGSKLIGSTVMDLARAHQMVIVSYKRGAGTIFHPPSDVVVEKGDVLTLECEPQTLKNLHRLNGEPVAA